VQATLEEAPARAQGLEAVRLLGNLRVVSEPIPSFQRPGPDLQGRRAPTAQQKASQTSKYQRHHQLIKLAAASSTLGSQAPVAYGQAFQNGGTPNLPSANSGFDDRTNGTPYMMQYNLNIQRDIGFGTILTVGYVGSEGVHLLADREENSPTPVIDANGVYHFADLVNGKIVPHPKLNPLLGPLPIKKADGHSNYNSLQVGLNRRLSNRLQFQVSYTYSKSTDNSSQSNGLESSNSPGSVMNEFLMSQDRSRSDFDRTHSLRVSGVYSLPFRGNALVSGWHCLGVRSFLLEIPEAFMNERVFG
jgi:hypothetical protein